MKTTEILIHQLMVMEGHSLEAYKDDVGMPTIGYGHTKGVRMGDRISEQWAKELLKMDVQEVEEQVKALLGAEYSVTGRRKNAIKQECKRWVYARGRKLHGLELRREWEAKRFFE